MKQTWSPRGKESRLNRETGTDIYMLLTTWASRLVLAANNPSANAGNTGDSDSTPGSARPPGGRNGNPLQYSCLENPMDRGVSWATVHRVGKESDMTEVTWPHTIPYKVDNY